MIDIKSINENRYSCACSCNNNIYMFNTSNSHLFIAEDTISEVTSYNYNDNKTSIKKNYKKIASINGYVHSACNIDDENIIFIREESINGTRSTQFICSKFNIKNNLYEDLSPIPRPVVYIAHLSENIFVSWNGSYQFVTTDCGYSWKSTNHSLKEYAIITLGCDNIYILRKNKIFIITKDMILSGNTNEKLFKDLDMDSSHIQYSKFNNALYVFFYKNKICYMKNITEKGDTNTILYKNAKTETPDIVDTIIHGRTTVYTIIDQVNPFSNIIALIKSTDENIDVLDKFTQPPRLLHTDEEFALYGSVFPNNNEEFYMFSINIL